MFGNLIYCALALIAVGKWCVPWGITPHLYSAASVTQAVTYELWVYDSIGMTAAELEAAVAAALLAWFAARPIGGDVKASVGSGKLYCEGIKEAIKSVCGAHFVDLVLTVPASDIAITAGQIAALGAIVPTGVHFESKPTVIG